MFKKVLKILGIVLVVLVVAAGTWVGANWQGIQNLRETNAAWYAQMTCSCIFVVGRKEQACKDYVRQFMPSKYVRIDRNEKQVVAKGVYMGRVATSKYEGPRWGCRLVNP